MQRVDKLISTFVKRRYGLSLTRVYAKLRADLLHDLESVPCNLCGGDALIEVARRDKYDLAVITVMCRTCGLLYLNPRPTEESYNRFYFEGGSTEGVYHMSLGLDNVEAFLRRYYGPEFRMSDADVKELQNFIREKFSEHVGKDPDGLADQEILQALEAKAREFEAWRYQAYAEEIYLRFRDFVPQNGKIFEVGAAWGKLLVPWRDRHGCQVTGLEPRKATVQAAKDRLGIELFQGFPATATIAENTYDAVLNIRTINHMLDPAGDLRHAWRWLKPGGVLIVDISDAVREAHYEGFESNVVEIDHTYMFSSNTLAAMLQKAGFEIVSCDIADTSHVFWGEQREPQYKQIRLVGRKVLDPIEIAWPDPLQEMANLLQAQLAREASLLLRESERRKNEGERRKKKTERKGKKAERRNKEGKPAGFLADAKSATRGIRRVARRIWRKASA